MVDSYGASLSIQIGLRLDRVGGGGAGGGGAGASGGGAGSAIALYSKSDSSYH